MSVFVPWTGRRSSIFDLEHIGGLSANPTIPLLVSPQVLYALQNVALVEIADPNRYAVSLTAGGYYRVQPEDTADYALFLEIVSQVGLQLSDYLTMSTPLNFAGSHAGSASNLNAAAGSNTLELAVPTGNFAWCVQAYHVYNANTANPTIYIVANDGAGVTVELDRFTGLADTVLRGHVPVTLAGNDVLQAVFVGCNTGDDIYFRAWGYLMELLT